MKNFILITIAALVMVAGAVFLLVSEDTSPDAIAEDRVVKLSEVETEMDYCFSTDEEIVNISSEDDIDYRSVSLAGSFTSANIEIPTDAEIVTIGEGADAHNKVILERDENGNPYNVLTIREHKSVRDVYDKSADLVYEGLSDRWYKIDYAAEGYSECMANEYGRTDNGDPIYKTGIGDASYRTITYLVAVGDSRRLNEPYLFVFDVSNFLYDSEGGENPNYKDYTEMKGVVESIVQSLHQGEVQG